MPFLWELFGSSDPPQGLLTTTQMWAVKRRFCLKAAALQTPGNLRHRETL